MLVYSKETTMATSANSIDIFNISFKQMKPFTSKSQKDRQNNKLRIVIPEREIPNLK